MTRDISISASSAFFWWKMQKMMQLIDNQSFTPPHTCYIHTYTPLKVYKFGSHNK